MYTLEPDHAVFPLGKKFAKVISEPALKEVRFNGKTNYYAHFQARGRSGELVDCVASHSRALDVVREMNVDDEIIVDEKVEIKPGLNVLEYRYSGYFICINPR